ncbi:hypothetical protein NE237_011956 [Protea cynaroides]|uniref:Uncharacterized protein n=1 Tax=Protea cynaroides TaxID=273540 RepID=A0A9Q0JYU1_9MAGN|nr:hypothetical protein NE237_011956 [Protea cynaroides]
MVHPRKILMALLAEEANLSSTPSSTPSSSPIPTSLVPAAEACGSPIDLLLIRFVMLEMEFHFLHWFLHILMCSFPTCQGEGMVMLDWVCVADRCGDGRAWLGVCCRQGWRAQLGVCCGQVWGWCVLGWVCVADRCGDGACSTGCVLRTGVGMTDLGVVRAWLGVEVRLHSIGVHADRSEGGACARLGVEVRLHSVGVHADRYGDGAKVMAGEVDGLKRGVREDGGERLGLGSMQHGLRVCVDQGKWS